jgi:hypothetical protein
MSALASGDHAVCLGYRLSKYPLNRRLEQDEQGRQRPIALAGFSLLSTAGHRLASPHFAQLLAAALFIATAHNYPEHAVKHDLGVVPSYSSSKGQEPQPARSNSTCLSRQPLLRHNSAGLDKPRDHAGSPLASTLRQQRTAAMPPHQPRPS